MWVKCQSIASLSKFILLHLINILLLSDYEHLIQLFVGGCMHVLFTSFVFVCVYWCPTHILLYFWFCFLHLVYPMLPVSLDWPFFISSSVFSNVYLIHSNNICNCKLFYSRWFSSLLSYYHLHQNHHYLLQNLLHYRIILQVLPHCFQNLLHHRKTLHIHHNCQLRTMVALCNMLNTKKGRTGLHTCFLLVFLRTDRLSGMCTTNDLNINKYMLYCISSGCPRDLQAFQISVYKNIARPISLTGSLLCHHTDTTHG